MRLAYLGVKSTSMIYRIRTPAKGVRMSIRVSKSSPKIFLNKGQQLQDLVVNTMKKVSDAVSSSLGPGGRPTLIEAHQPGFVTKATKDGVTIMRALGSTNT